MSSSRVKAIEQRDRSLARVRSEGAALDVSELPSFGFSHRSLMWWGTAAMIAIEGTVFALGVVSYFYLRSHSTTWPMGCPAPDAGWGTLNTAILLASLWPNQWTKSAAERLDLKVVRIGLVVCLLFSVAFLVVRALEFTSLHCRWDDSAYGSIVWMLIGLHTTHLLTDALDSAVLTALMFTEPTEGRRFVDVSESAVYWYFVVLTWLPLYAVIYLAPRSL
ncbi:MAG TPA: cytochrome c oxidase subunit 3 [Albitalea sp.]|uniref:cytochrome c oxidase subunit 3 n=1 Tax=Piscinibacter sp. TaxID=1903157 RepID=UPI002ED6246E